MEKFQPLNYEEADKKADEILKRMSLAEKILLTGGDRNFFIRPFPEYGLSEVYMSDATQGIHLREEFDDVDLSEYQLKKSTAFPCPILLASTWNPELSFEYAKAIGEECSAGGIGVLLGPGMNIYRHSQCGRNFEYFGEDPFLAARMIEEYVSGIQSTGTAATLKHFAANNTDYFRRKSNSIVDERTLHEIYLPAFKAGIDAGAAAVMTAYNLLNGEWCGESSYVINYLLRDKLGFKLLVMTDWWSVYNGEKLAKSGQDLEMPYIIALENSEELLNEGKINEEDINRMAKSILRFYFAMKMGDKKRNDKFLDKYEEHELIALETAREGIILLKNDDYILPLNKNYNRILLTGDFVETLASGGGAAYVEGYNRRLMYDTLNEEFGERLYFSRNPSVEEIKSADIVLCNIGTIDSEGWDRPFELPEDQEKIVLDCINNNKNTIVVVTSGSGIKMTNWHEKAKGIIYAWYGGQIGNKALAEIIAGRVNPSGKLPITIEKDFKDSPGFGYIPDEETLYSGWNDEEEKLHPVYDIYYKEGVFVGYRWYESKNIEPLYPFGYGLSFTSFVYSDIKVSKKKFNEDEIVNVTFKIRNSGEREGKETAQLYIQDVSSSLPRPVKELKGFKKIELKAGETRTVQFDLNKKHFSFWNPEIKEWMAEKGKFIIHIGTSSKDSFLQKEIELL